MNQPLPVQLAAASADAQFVNTPLRQRLKEALLRRILGGHYDAGERLVELRIAEEFGTSGVPENFLLDRRGKVRLLLRGPVTEEYLRESVAPLFLDGAS